MYKLFFYIKLIDIFSYNLVLFKRNILIYFIKIKVKLKTI